MACSIPESVSSKPIKKAAVWVFLKMRFPKTVGFLLIPCETIQGGPARWETPKWHRIFTRGMSLLRLGIAGVALAVDEGTPQKTND